MQLSPVPQHGAGAVRPHRHLVEYEDDLGGGSWGAVTAQRRQIPRDWPFNQSSGKFRGLSRRSNRLLYWFGMRPKEWFHTLLSLPTTAMTQEGATLQNYNSELVACIEELREKREELNKSIAADEEEKGELPRGHLHIPFVRPVSRCFLVASRDALSQPRSRTTCAS